ncbi:MAG: GTPase [archaeon]
MNFQDLKNVETSQFYLDVAFNKASKKASLMRSKKINNMLTKSRRIEEARISSVRDTIITALNRIITSFPNLDNLPEFYEELVKVTLDYEKVKKALASINWARTKVNELSGVYFRKMRTVKERSDASAVRMQYYGRISSVLARIDKHLKLLEGARKAMKDYPAIKTSLFTVAIAGFPNVGKSTLLSKLTTSTPEIKNYAFTTKKLNVGYLVDGAVKVQFVDTPGTLNRFDKMNQIEKQAFLAMKYVADMVVFVFDLTETYPVDNQEKLLERLKEFDKEIILYLSKTDLLDDKTIKEFKVKYKVAASIEGLKENIIKKSKV